MDTLWSNAASGLADIVARKWFAAMGLIGLLLFVTSLLFELPSDPVVVGCIGLMMFGYGFGQAECRTFTQQDRGRHIVTLPMWRLTVSGALLFAIAIGATVKLVMHLT